MRSCVVLACTFLVSIAGGYRKYRTTSPATPSRRREGWRAKPFCACRPSTWRKSVMFWCESMHTHAWTCARKHAQSQEHHIYTLMHTHVHTHIHTSHMHMRTYTHIHTANLYTSAPPSSPPPPSQSAASCQSLYPCPHVCCSQLQISIPLPSSLQPAANLYTPALLSAASCKSVPPPPPSAASCKSTPAPLSAASCKSLLLPHCLQPAANLYSCPPVCNQLQIYTAAPLSAASYKFYTPALLPAISCKHCCQLQIYIPSPAPTGTSCKHPFWQHCCQLQTLCLRANLSKVDCFVWGQFGMKWTWVKWTTLFQGHFESSGLACGLLPQRPSGRWDTAISFV